MSYKVIMLQNHLGYAASAPDFPMCLGVGATKEAALEDLKSSVRTYIAGSKQRPLAATHIELLDVALA
ncbi:MAG: hypothetical protein MJA83_02705 [Gammaproteobacteria bacterium]|nr:hypothetical protein [Gammaproteobacteria bacterium]